MTLLPRPSARTCRKRLSASTLTELLYHGLNTYNPRVSLPACLWAVPDERRVGPSTSTVLDISLTMSIAQTGDNVQRGLAIRRLCSFLFATLLCLAGSAGLNAQTDARKTVLVLYDRGREFSSVALLDRAIEATLNHAAPKRVTLFREFMDLTRIRPPNYEQVLRDFYRAKYSNNRPDVIVTIRGRTLDFVLKPGDELFPGDPIVATAMDERQVKATNLPSHVTGVTLPLKFWPTVLLARNLQPDVEHAVFVGGVSPNDRAVEMLARDELREHEAKMKFTYLTGLPMETIMQLVSDLPPRSVILYLLVTEDGEGRSFMPDEVITRIAGAANVPMYVLSDNNLELGAVGGDLQSFEVCGRDTAKDALRILAGESAASIPFAESSSRVKVLDARQLDRWSIPSARVPFDALVVNRLPGMWEQYRWQIVGGVSLIVLQSVLIAALLVNRSRRRAAEQDLQISKAHGRAAVLEERNRMARDMHDTLAQGFTGVIVQLQAAEQAVAHGSTADTDAHIHRASDLARQSLDEARRSIRALRPQALEEGDLCAALADVTKQLTAGTGVRAEFSVRGHPYPLPPSSEENLLRMHQEILTNTLKHANAKSIKATLSFDQSNVCLDVADDGTGFDLGNKHDGLGLLGMRERVNQMDGKFTVDSRVGVGTAIHVVLPSRGALRDARSEQSSDGRTAT